MAIKSKKSSIPSFLDTSHLLYTLSAGAIIVGTSTIHIITLTNGPWLSDDIVTIMSQARTEEYKKL